MHTATHHHQFVEKTQIPAMLLQEVTFRPTFAVDNIYPIILWISQRMLKPDMGRYSYS